MRRVVVDDYIWARRSALVLLELLLLVPFGVLGQAPIATQCTQEQQRRALELIYARSNGTGWLNQALWNTNGTCVQYLHPRSTNYTALRGSGISLPSFCCWAGVDCCLSASYNSDFTECTEYQCECTVGTVTGLSLGRNHLAGWLPYILGDEVLDALACSLRMVFLGGNGPALNGTVPPGIGNLTELRILSLSSNGLTGTIPEALTRLALLEELDLSNNDLTGSVPSLLCGGPERESHLRDLILSNNNLTGQLDLPSCGALIYLDAQNNWLTGPMPDISSYRQLHILRLGNNLFNGSLSLDAFDLRLLVVLDLSLNYFSGPLPNFVGNSSQLTMVRLSNNSFSGTISPDLFTVGTLGNFLANDNQLTGTLPENIGYARGISSLNLRNNNLHGTLPPSLELLAPNLGTVDVSFNMLSCCGRDFVEGRGYKYFDLDASPLPRFLVQSDLVRPVVDSYTTFPNLRCPFIIVNPNSTSDDFLAWAIDPEYYLYKGCTCLEGFIEVWTSHTDGEPSMGPVLTCVRVMDPWYIKYPWAVVLIVLGGLLIALWLTYLMCFRRGKNAAIVQGCFNIRKRIQGEPVGGQVSIVVTDIEGYSDLMKQSPQLMTRALNTHNAIVRKSRWNNFGYTVEQEGDSYALVFYEAHDAVIFCLQTQLALNRQTWPEGLFGNDAREQAMKRRPQAPSLLNAISVMTNNLTHSLFWGRANAPGQEDRSAALMAAPSGLNAGDTSLDGRPESLQSSMGTSLAIEPPQPPAAAAAPELSGLMSPSGLAAAAGSNPTRGHPVLFNGLRVRMGVATGALPPGSNSKGSAVMDMAKVVSDAANGGQIMVDEATFKAVKERIEEFGAVDHNGMNFKKLNSIQPPWYSCLKRKHLRNPDDALLLDMGEYTHCPGCKRVPLFQLEGTPAGETPVGGEGAQQAGGPLPPATPRNSRNRGKASEPMRLYQLVPPQLVARAKVFGNKVTVKDEWYCSDAPYFDAPGTVEAPLGPVEGPGALPPITMAFAIVEGGKAFAGRHRRDVRRVNDVAAACIRACLRVVRGGYLCRMQDGDLKYMVAFASPEAAVEWSLLLQDVLMYADWPEAALKFWREEYDEQGRMVFRGPRMKIGLCEGSPRSIIPDHIGRADYHGASVNQAARYMDAAAHGGMIAIEATLAVKVMETWRAAAAAAAAEAARAAAANVVAAGASAFAEAATASAAGIRSAPSAPSAFASAATSASGASVSAGGSVKAGRVGSSTAVGGAASAAVPAPPPVSRAGSRKGRMAAVKEADGAEEPAMGRDAAAGPVAEAAEGDGVDAAAMGNGDSSSSVAAPPPPLPAGTAVLDDASAGPGGRPPAESGPSMTSLASSSHITAARMMGAGSSTPTAPGPLLPFGSSTSEVEGQAAAAPPPPPLPVAMAGFGVSTRPTSLAHVPSTDTSYDGSTSYIERTTAAVASGPGGGARISAPGMQRPPVDLQPSGSASSLPPRPRLSGAAAAQPAPLAFRHPASGPRTHVSFAAERFDPVVSHPISAAGSSVPSPAAGQPPQRAFSAAAGSSVAAAAAAAADGAQLSPGTSSLRSPRPPSLTPLSLPSERERDETLRAERAAAEASKKVSVDGPADASYRAHVLAFRIGVFRFKGSPEPIPMAHIILEHLAGRSFPADAPKGKGAKVGDASGRLDECDTPLPDLASLMRDRYMLLNGPVGAGRLGPSLTLDVNHSSSSHRRLRGLLGGASSPTGHNAGGGDGSSPRAAIGSALGKSRSLAVRNSGALTPGSTASAGGNSASDSGVSPSAVAAAASGSDGGGGPRRGLMTQLASFATSSMRWASGRVPGARAGTGTGPGQRDGAVVAGGGSGDLPPQAGNGAHGGGCAAVAGGSAAAPRVEGPAVEMAVAVELDATLTAGGQGQGAGRTEGQARPGPSPLRFVTGRDDPPPDREPGAAVATAQDKAAAGDSVEALRGDEHV